MLQPQGLQYKALPRSISTSPHGGHVHHSFIPRSVLSSISVQSPPGENPNFSSLFSPTSKGSQPQGNVEVKLFVFFISQEVYSYFFHVKEQKSHKGGISKIIQSNIQMSCSNDVQLKYIIYNMTCVILIFYILRKIYVRLHNTQNDLEKPASRLSAVTSYQQGEGGGWNSGI